MVRERIERLKRERGWEFVFFGANMDAIVEAGKIGIEPDHAHNYSATSAGIQAAYSAMSAVSTSYRTGGGMGMQLASEPANNDDEEEESLVDAIARQVGAIPHDISDEEKEETLREFYEIFAPVNMERDLKAIRENWAPAAVIIDACRLREDDIDRQGKEEAPAKSMRRLHCCRASCPRTPSRWDDSLSATQGGYTTKMKLAYYGDISMRPRQAMRTWS